MKKRFFVKRIATYTEGFKSYRITYYDCLKDAKRGFYDIYNHFMNDEVIDETISVVFELCDNEDCIVLLDAIFEWNSNYD